MARTSLRDVGNLSDPLMTYNFDLQFNGIEDFGDARDITIRLMTTSLPGMQIDQVTVPLHGVEVNYAGRQIYSKQFTATLHETRDVKARDFLRKWTRACRNNLTNKGLLKERYAKNATMILYDDVPNVVSQTLIVGIWPLSFDDLQLDGSQSTAAQYNVTFSFDYTIEQGESAPAG